MREELRKRYRYRGRIEAYARKVRDNLPQLQAGSSIMPAKVNPVVPTQLIVDHSLAVEHAGFEPDAFEMSEEEIMPLGDDDILNAEDLEPVLQEPTLAAWSRNAAPEEDIVSEPPDQMSAVDEDVFAATETVFGEEPTAAVVEPVSEETEVTEPPAAEPVPAFVEPVAEPAPQEELPPAAEKEPEPATVAATVVDAEEKAAALSEDEIEQIIEKVVTNVVEKLAGTILERVAWEVVPDLAEHLIREEIRKIKDAAA